MENPVYDGVTRRLGAIVLLVVFVPIIPVLSALRSLAQKPSDQILTVMVVVMVLLVMVSAGLLLLIHLTTNVWISIDPMRRTVVQTYKLFGYSVHRKTYDLSQFDRISLHRALRGGYRATLVGREKEVVLSASWKLGWVRHAAEQAATSIGLRMSDQL